MKPFLEINNLCIACDYCKIICPEDAIVQTTKGYSIENWSCTLCGLCIEICPVKCIRLNQNPNPKALENPD